MIYERLIHDYLDNELDQTGEEALFNHLSTNESLRLEFNRQMKLQQLAQKDMLSITVPSDVTAGVFGKLGFAVPAYPNAVAVADKNIQSKYSAKYLSAILLLLLMFTATASYYLATENSNLKSKITSLKSGKSSYPVMTSEEVSNNSGQNIAANQENNDLNNRSSYELDNSNRGGNSNNRNNYSNYGRNKSDDHSGRNIKAANAGNNDLSSGNELLTDSESGSNSIQSIVTFSNFLGNNNDYDEIITIQNYRNNNSLNSQQNIQISGFAYNPTNLYDLNLPNWSIQFRRMSGEKIYPPPTLQQESSTFADNAIGLWYHSSPEISFGIEVGSEMFSQEFTVNKLNYVQSPILTWTGLSVRYNPSDWIIPYTVNPYFTQTLAYTSIGPLSKTQGGITFSPVSPLTLFVGAEYGLLFYSPGGSNLYTSGKLGFTGGVSINLR
jgi:hypothetical protein